MQTEFLKSAGHLLKKGGIMVYSVCSMEPEEGDQGVYNFLQENRNFSIIISIII
jgi:16S rRNA (cytosine967-C5)-methyltransferase